MLRALLTEVAFISSENTRTILAFAGSKEVSRGKYVTNRGLFDCPTTDVVAVHDPPPIRCPRRFLSGTSSAFTPPPPGLFQWRLIQRPDGNRAGPTYHLSGDMM